MAGGQRLRTGASRNPAMAKRKPGRPLEKRCLHEGIAHKSQEDKNPGHGVAHTTEEILRSRIKKSWVLEQTDEEIQESTKGIELYMQAPIVFRRAQSFGS